MSRWALTVKQHVGHGSYQVWETTVIDEVTGTHEQALAALWTHAVNYRPRHPRTGSSRRRVLRDDDGFQVINEGSGSRSYSCEFRVREVLWDSAAGH